MLSQYLFGLFVVNLSFFMGWGPLSSQRSPKITGKGQPGLLSKLVFSYFVVFHWFSFLLFILTAAGTDISARPVSGADLLFNWLSEVVFGYSESVVIIIVVINGHNVPRIEIEKIMAVMWEL